MKWEDKRTRMIRRQESRSELFRERRRRKRNIDRFPSWSTMMIEAVFLRARHAANRSRLGEFLIVVEASLAKWGSELGPSLKANGACVTSKFEST